MAKRVDLGRLRAERARREGSGGKGKQPPPLGSRARKKVALTRALAASSVLAGGLVGLGAHLKLEARASRDLAHIQVFAVEKAITGLERTAPDIEVESAEVLLSGRSPLTARRIAKLAITLNEGLRPHEKEAIRAMFTNDEIGRIQAASARNDIGSIVAAIPERKREQIAQMFINERYRGKVYFAPAIIGLIVASVFGFVTTRWARRL